MLPDYSTEPAAVQRTGSSLRPPCDLPATSLERSYAAGLVKASLILLRQSMELLYARIL